MTAFTMYVDEHGSVGSDRENEVWGYGYCILPSADVPELETRLRAAFPHGLHLKSVRRNRKAKRVRELVKVLPTQTFFGGAHVQTTIDYGTRTYHRVLSGTGPTASADQRRDLEQLVMLAPIGPAGLVNPRDVLVDATQEFRLQQIYTHAFRFPVLALRRAIPGSAPLEVEIVAGHVGAAVAHQRQITEFKDELQDFSAAAYERFSHASINVSVRFTSGDETAPIFGVADFFAGVARHYYQSLQPAGDGLGGELYRIVQPIFQRLPKMGDQHLADGITYV